MLGALALGAAAAVAAAGLVVGSGYADAATGVPPPRPRIVWKPIPFGATRRAEMAAYARRHYGRDTWRLRRTRR